MSCFYLIFQPELDLAWSFIAEESRIIKVDTD